MFACFTSTLQQNFFRDPILSPYEYISEPENRAFGVNILAYNYLNSFLSATVTSTVLKTTTSTVTVATLATCYTSSLFSKFANCRRRREVIAVLKALDEMTNDDSIGDIRPSEIEL